MTYTYQYPRPALTVDCVIFGLDRESLKVLLIQRANPPFQNCWALPGGFAEVGEALDDSARRELEEETGLSDIPLEQFHTFSDPKRDPREHVISTAYFALVNRDACRVQAASDARHAAWFPLSNLPNLAFDHAQILAMAHARLRAKIAHHPIGADLLPDEFPLRQLREIYEMMLACPLDPPTFRRKILRLGILEELDKAATDTSCRGKLYRFDRQACARKLKQGYRLEF